MVPHFRVSTGCYLIFVHKQNHTLTVTKSIPNLSVHFLECVSQPYAIDRTSED